MGKFLRRLALLLGGLVLLTLILDQVSSALLLRGGAPFRVDEKATSVVLGHSHPATDYDTGVIRGLVNLGAPSEYAFVTYAKARALAAENPALDTFFLEFSNNMITERFNDSEPNLRHVNKQYAYLLPYGLRAEVINRYPTSVIHYAQAVYTEKLNQLALLYLSPARAHEDLGLAGYSPRTGTHDEQDGTAPTATVYTWSVDFLERAVEALGDRVVILLRSPIHVDNVERDNEADFQALLRQRFGDTPFLDFADYPAPDSAFYDYGHLNADGAAAYSSWFARFRSTQLDSVLSSGTRHHKFF